MWKGALLVKGFANETEIVRPLKCMKSSENDKCVDPREERSFPDTPCLNLRGCARSLFQKKMLQHMGEKESAIELE